MNKADILSIQALLPAQQGMLLAALKEGPETYLQQLLFRIDQHYNEVEQEKAIQRLCKSYECLSALLLYQGLKQPMWVQLKGMQPEFEIKNASTEELPNIMAADRARGFDFQKKPLIRFLYLKTEEGDYLLISNHHALFDGWGRQQLLGDFIRLLQAPWLLLPERKTKPWVEAWKKLPQEAALQAYRNYIFEAETWVEIQKVPEQTKSEQQQYGMLLAAAPLRALAQRFLLTQAEALSFAWACFAAVWTANPYCCFGTVKQNGLFESVPDGFGLGIQTLPLLFEVQEQRSFAELSLDFKARERAVADFPFVNLGDKLFNKLRFDFIIAFENYPLESLLASDTGFELISSYDYSEFPLSLALTPAGEELIFDWHYDLSQHSREQIATIAQYFGQFIEKTASGVFQKPADFRQVLAANYPKTPLLELAENALDDFFAQWYRGLAQTAIEGIENPTDTYLRLLNYIQKNNKNKLLWICGDKHPLSPLLLAAAWESGLTTFMLNESEAEDYIEKLYEQTSPGLLIGRPLAFKKLELLSWEALEQALEQSLPIEPIGEKKLDPNFSALGICTSGSTGDPKVVLLSLQNMISFFKAWEEKLPWRAAEHFAAIAHPAFDIGVAELFFPVWKGWKLSLISKNELSNFESLTQKLSAVTAFHAVPAVLEKWLGHLERNKGAHLIATEKIIMTGGDKVPYWLQSKIAKLLPQAKLFQFYGPSECSVLSSGFENEGNYPQSLLPIGTAFAHANLWVFDKNGNLAAPFQEGELWVSGPAVGLGYLKRNGEALHEVKEERGKIKEESRTVSQDDSNESAPRRERGSSEEEKSPFLISAYQDKRYSTGDYSFYSPSGFYYFLGRKDNQIKINGQRIETSRIEAALASWSGIDFWVIIYQDKQLLAFYKSVQPIAADKQLLNGLLPSFAIPGRLIALSEFPLNKNGKIDRKALSALAQSEVFDSSAKELTEAWRNILSELFPEQDLRPNLGWYANGLNSLDALRLAGKLQSLKKKEFSLQSILSIASLADLESLTEEAATTEQLPLRDATLVSESVARLLFLSESDEALNAAYILETGFILKEKIDVMLLQAWLQLQDWAGIRAKVEGANYYWEFGKTELYIAKSTNAAAFVKELQDLALNPFEGLFMLAFAQFDNAKNALAIRVHHALLDGLGLEQLWKHLFELLTTKKPKPIALFSSAQKEAKLDFWKNYLQPIALQKLPFQRRPLAESSSSGNVWRYQLNTAEKEALRKLAATHQIGIFEAGLLLWAQLWAQFFPDGNFATGIPVSTRNASSETGIETMSVNILPFKIKAQFLHSPQALIESWRKVFAERQTAFSKIATLDKSEQKEGMPFFNTSFLYHAFKPLNSGFEALPFERKSAEFPLSLELIEEGEAFTLSWEYRTDLFTEKAIARFNVQYLQQLQKQSESQGLIRLEAINFEKNNSESLADIWQKVLFARGNAIALKWKNQSWTFEALNEKISAYRQLLRKKGARLLLLLLDRDVEAIALLLSCLLEEITFIPIDSETPTARVARIESLTGETALGPQDLAGWQPSLKISDCWNKEIVYAIATSGSTGLPKLVGIRRQGYLSAIAAWKKDYGMHADDICLQTASFSFDVAMGDIGRSFFQGASLVLCDAFERKDPDKIWELIQKEKITVFETTPLIVRWWMSQRDFYWPLGINLRLLIVGSDSWRMRELRKLAAYKPKGLKIISSYGLSETTIDNSFFDIDVEESAVYGDENLVPIGRPMSHSQMFISAGDKQRLCDGQEGFISFLGPCLGLGYYNENSRCFESPTTDFWCAADLGIVDEYGIFHFLGRGDRQVKIRGQRVELTEIETILARLQSSCTWALVDIPSELGTEMAAFYQGKLSSANVQALRAELLNSYPAYYLPAKFIAIQKLPLNQNGKIDQHKLRKIASATELETIEKLLSENIGKRLVELYEQLFGEKAVPADNFFRLGRNSFDVMRFTRRWNELNAEKLQVQQLFVASNFEQLAQGLELSQSNVEKPENQAAKRLISKAQEAIWYELDKGKSSLYNLPHLLQIPAEYETEKAIAAFEKALQHCPALFVAFTADEMGNVWEQQLQSESYRLPQLKIAKNELKEAFEKAFFRELDLTKGPAFEAAVWKTEVATYLFFNPHHLVYDGGSDAVLTELIQAFYNNTNYQPLENKIEHSAEKVEIYKVPSNITPAPNYRKRKRPSPDIGIAEIQLLSEADAAIFYAECRRLAAPAALLMSRILGEALQSIGISAPWLSLVLDTRMGQEALGLYMRAFPFATGGTLAAQKAALAALFAASSAQIVYPEGTNAADYHQVGLVIQHPFDWAEAATVAAITRPRLPLTLYMEQGRRGEICWRWEYDSGFYELSEIIQLKTAILSALHALSQLSEASETVEKEETTTNKVSTKSHYDAELSALWQQYTGFLPEIETHFFNAGGNSIKAIHLLRNWEQRKGLTLPAALFFRHPTADFVQQFANGFVLDVELLWELQKGDAEREIWLFPPILGYAMIYNSLKLPQGQRVLAFNYPTALDENSKLDSIEAIAVCLLAAAASGSTLPKAVQLLGYSMGGIVAFELAKLLEAMGVETELLILDKPAQPQGAAIEQHESLKLELEEIVTQLALDEEQATKMRRYLLRHENMIENYIQKGCLQGDIQLFYCNNGFDKKDLAAWAGFTKGKFSSEAIESQHYEIPKVWNELLLWGGRG